MKFLFVAAGLLLVFAVGYLFSNNRKGIRSRPILAMLVTQIVLSFIILNTKIGLELITFVSRLFNKLMEFGVGGVNFVFGGLENQGASTFFINVLLPIIFISILIGILNYVKVLPFVIKYVGLALSKLNGMGRLENYVAVSAALLGQSEVFLTTKKQLSRVTKQRLYTLCTSAMSAVSISIVGAYMTMLEPKYVVVAIVLNIFSALIVANIINPYKLDPEEEQATVVADEEHQPKESFFQMISESIMDGFKVAIIVGAMLIDEYDQLRIRTGIPHFVPVRAGLYFRTGRVPDGHSVERSRPGGGHHGDEACDQRIRGDAELQRHRFGLIGPYGRDRLGIPGQLCELQLYWHYYRRGESAERQTGRRGCAVRLEAAARLDAGLDFVGHAHRAVPIKHRLLYQTRGDEKHENG